MTVRGLMTLMLLLLGAGTAVAQKGPPASRLTMSAGMLTSGGYGIGDAAAQMRRSAPGPESLVTVLRAESRIGTATGLDARLAWALNNDVAVEVGGSYMAPTARRHDFTGRRGARGDGRGTAGPIHHGGQCPLPFVHQWFSFSSSPIYRWRRGLLVAGARGPRHAGDRANHSHGRRCELLHSEWCTRPAASASVARRASSIALVESSSRTKAETIRP